MTQGQHTILIVEDDVRMQQALKDRLHEEGYRVLVTDSVDPGMAILRKEKIALILLDLRLDEKSGLTLMDEMRDDPAIDHKKIVTVVLTAIADPAMVADVMGHGTTDYLVKSDNSLEDIAAFIGKKLAKVAWQISNF